MGKEVQTNETSNSIVGKASSLSVTQSPTKDIAKDKKISNIVLGSQSYDAKLPTESHASYQRPASDLQTS